MHKALPYFKNKINHSYGTQILKKYVVIVKTRMSVYGFAHSP